MGMLKFQVSHRLSKEEAQARTEKLVQHWVDKYGISARWTGDEATFEGKVMGVSLTASLKVAAGSVGGEAKDPGMLLRGTAKKYLEEKFAAYLDPATKLADL